MKGNAIIVDTNVLIHDPASIYTLMNDINTIFIHSSVIMELDNLKTNREVGRDCREVIRIIEKLQLEDNYRLKIINDVIFDDNLSHLDKTKTDHKIISLAYNMTKDYNKKYNKIKLISRDTNVRILARTLDILVQDYVSDDITNTIPKKIKTFEVPLSIIDKKTLSFKLETDCIENEGIICKSNWDGSLKDINVNSDFINNFTAIKKGDIFKVIPNNINALNITPYTMEDDREPNWEQYIALYQLLDTDINLSFIMGSSGSGKTLLSIASAIHNRSEYRNILVSRPMVSMGDDDKMGYLPGTIEEKMNPWIKPIFRILTFLSSINTKNKNIIEKIRSSNKKKFDIESIDYMRGNTFHKDILIIDEAQNLTPHVIKSIISRCGEYTKIIFTGDLNQIDKNYLNARSSGLNYASVRMKDNPMVSSIYLNKTVRSKLVEYSEQVL